MARADGAQLICYSILAVIGSIVYLGISINQFATADTDCADHFEPQECTDMQKSAATSNILLSSALIIVFGMLTTCVCYLSARR